VNFIRRLFAIFGMISLLLFLLVVVSAALLAWFGTRIEQGTVLELNLERRYVEYAGTDVVGRLLGGAAPTVLGVVRALDAASRDDRVIGLVAKVGEDTNLGFAQVQEIRDAVARFRRSGKRTVAWSESFGEFGPGNRAYYLATAFEHIYLTPSGDLGLTGMVFASPFVAGTLDKLGVRPQLGKRGRYKNAVNLFTERRFTKAHRESVEDLMHSLFVQLLDGVGDARGMGRDRVKAIVDGGPYTAREALEKGLVDGLLYRDEVYDGLERASDVKVHFLDLFTYLARVGGEWSEGDEEVAVVYGSGTIRRGSSGYDPLFGTTSMGSTTVAKAVRDAAGDKGVKAIVFRVDSPGGSVVASDIIWRELVKARQQGKPVVVSMGNYAASGGYWVSTAADRIVAEPGTITGSIGVFAGKFYARKFWGMLGVTWDEVHTSRNSLLWSSLVPYDDEQWKIVQRWLDGIYDEFISRVAEARGMPVAQVRKIAEGKVWSGAQAKALGLVDELGGMKEAVDLAKKLAGIAPEAKVRLVFYPRPKPLWKSVLELVTGEHPDDGGVVYFDDVRRVAVSVAPLLSGATRALRPADTALLMPGVLE